jgi:hypothetical protein
MTHIPVPQEIVLTTLRWLCPKGHHHTTREVAEACIANIVRRQEIEQRRKARKAYVDAAGGTVRASALDRRKNPKSIYHNRIKDGPWEGLPIKVMEALEKTRVTKPDDLTEFLEIQLRYMAKRACLGELLLWMDEKGLKPREPEVVCIPEAVEYPTLEKPSFPPGFWG